MNAKLHFDGPQHQNKVFLMCHRKKKNQNLIICEICCVEVNTEKALELHKQSPKHLEKEQDWLKILDLKKEYEASKNFKTENQSSSTN
jgi:hypothetical protein